MPTTRPTAHGDEGAGERVAGAVDDAGEKVAPQRIGAEPVLGARRAQLLAGTPTVPL